MQLQPQLMTSQEILQQVQDEAAISKEERRRTGRYLAGGVALAIILIAIHHTVARGTSTIAGIWTPAIIMAAYIIWVLYAARKDREKAVRLASARSLAPTNHTSSNGNFVPRNSSTATTKTSSEVV